MFWQKGRGPRDGGKDGEEKRSEENQEVLGACTQPTHHECDHYVLQNSVKNKI